MGSIFTKIIQGQVPCYKVWENETCFAFLDIRPIRPGHTLVVPKLEVDKLFDLPKDAYGALFEAARCLAPAISVATGCARVGLAVQGFEVPHCHIHLLPMDSPRDMDFSRGKPMVDTAMRDIQQKIIKSLDATA